MSTLQGLLGAGAGGGGGAIPINGIAQFANVPTLYEDTIGQVWLKAGNISYDWELYPNAIKEYLGLAGSTTHTLYPVQHGASFQQHYQFSTDGTMFFQYGASSNNIQKFICSTPFDVTTALWHSMKQIGLNLYTARITYTGTHLVMVNQYRDSFQVYSMSTPWDISTLSSTGATFPTYTESADTSAVAISENGLKVYVNSLSNNRVYEYVLSTAWDSSTATYTGSFLTTGTECYAIQLSPDGGYLFANYEHYKARWTMTTPYTASTQTGKVTSPYDAGLHKGLYITSDGLTMYASDVNVFSKYTFGTAWTLSTLSAPTTIVTTQFTEQLGSPDCIWFKPDGLKAFIGSYDDIATYNLSVAWDWSTAVLVSEGTSILTGTADATSFYIKDDGLTLWTTYVFWVDKYTFGTAWDISTLTFSSRQTINTLGETESHLTSIFFKPDGTKVWMAGIVDKIIRQYSLPTPWDVASRTLDAGSYSEGPYFAGGLWFDPDGLAFYLHHSNGTLLKKYNLSIAWDLAGTKTLDSQMTMNYSPTSIFISLDNSKVFIPDKQINLVVKPINEYRVGLVSATGLDPLTYLRLK